MTDKQHLIAEGELTIKGKSSNGDTVEVIADIKDLVVEVDTVFDYNYGYGNYSTKAFPVKRNVSFHMDVKDTYQVKIPLAPTVDHTARVLGWEDPEGTVPREPTIALLRAAAQKAGVDETTDFNLVYEKDLLRRSNKVYVEFKWKQ